MPETVFLSVEEVGGQREREREREVEQTPLVDEGQQRKEEEMGERGRRGGTLVYFVSSSSRLKVCWKTLTSVPR